MNDKKIILASASPRRKQLMEMLGLDFKILTPAIDEQFSNLLSIDENIKNITQKKVFSVIDKHTLLDALIIAADTVVVLDGTVLTKPKDYADAFNILQKLSSQTHQVHTGIYVFDTLSSEAIYKSEKTKVTFKNINAVEIDAYIKTNEPFDKAGAYGIQGLGSVFIKRIEGCFYNVVGLPVSLLYDILKEFNIHILK
jgi:septum formation protein